jgi:CubicO group peptidase (beta-lactamase class C family)
MTAFGFVIDGKHYASGCQTRAGPWADCDVMPLPSYSTAKSLVAGLASMRLEQLVPGSMARKIGAVVPACAGDRWADVTLSDALNMATGNFGQPGADADENADPTWSFLRSDDHAEKIRKACSAWPRAAKPGSKFAYHTSDTYILGAALTALWREHAGASGDFYNDLLVAPVWHALRLSPDIMSTRRTYDAAAQPFTGYGLTLHRDDVAKLAVFLNSEQGVIDGKPLLDTSMLRSALQRDPQNHGLEAGSATFRYRNGFWAWNATSYLHCARETWIPFMSGFGGITIALFPNNTAYYYFSDGGVFAWGRAAAEANRIRKFC